jgi:hypothetical protein
MNLQTVFDLAPVDRLWPKLRAAICLAVCAACLSGCLSAPEEHREDRVNEGMTFGEVKALLCSPSGILLSMGLAATSWTSA